MQLEPLFGRWSRYFIGTGLFAAGISSAITAPLAAAYAAAGIFGWEESEIGPLQEYLDIYSAHRYHFCRLRV